MAEFCLDCWNKIMETNDPAEKYLMSRELYLCEECGEWKPVILRIRGCYAAAQWVREKVDCLKKYEK